MKHLVLLFLLTSCGYNKDNRPLLLVIGDSISIGYSPHLVSLLPEFRIEHNNGNAQNSTKTLQHIDQWLADRPSVIVWNNGNWDAREPTSYVGDSPQFVANSLQDYQANIIAIAQRMTATGARVYFVTTTNTIQGNPLYVDGRAEAQNQIAKTVLPQLGVTIIDLHEFQLPNTNWFIAPNDVHFSDYGNKQNAIFIAEKIRSLTL